jgi:hypothetical protein
MLISAGSLMLALLGGGWSLIKSEVNSVRREMNDLKELTASERSSISHRLENDEKETSQLRDNKVDIQRWNQLREQLLIQLVPASQLRAHDEVLQKQIDALAGRLNKLEKDHTPPR